LAGFFLLRSAFGFAVLGLLYTTAAKARVASDFDVYIRFLKMHLKK